MNKRSECSDGKLTNPCIDWTSVRSLLSPSSGSDRVTDQFAMDRSFLDAWNKRLCKIYAFIKDIQEIGR